MESPSGPGGPTSAKTLGREQLDGWCVQQSEWSARREAPEIGPDQAGLSKLW